MLPRSFGMLFLTLQCDWKKTKKKKIQASKLHTTVHPTVSPESSNVTWVFTESCSGKNIGSNDSEIVVLKNLNPVRMQYKLQITKWYKLHSFLTIRLVYIILYPKHIFSLFLTSDKDKQ